MFPACEKDNGGEARVKTTLHILLHFTIARQNEYQTTSHILNSPQSNLSVNASPTPRKISTLGIVGCKTSRAPQITTL